MKNFTKLDIAYEVSKRIFKDNFKLISNDNLIKIYCIQTNKKGVLLAYNNNNKNMYTLNFSEKTDISEFVDFFDVLYKNEKLEIENFEEKELEILTVDKVENIYITLLTEDDFSIVIDESFVNEMPKDSDFLNKRLEIDKNETKKVKDNISNRFNKLKKIK